MNNNKIPLGNYLLPASNCGNAFHIQKGKPALKLTSSDVKPGKICEWSIIVWKLS
jgi:hypothetical protein